MTETYRNLSDAPVGGYRRVTDINGQVAYIPQDDGGGHKNPPLTELNKAYREADRENRDEVDDALKQAHGVMQAALSGRGGRRVQKNLRPTIHLPNSGGQK